MSSQHAIKAPSSAVKGANHMSGHFRVAGKAQRCEYQGNISCGDCHDIWMDTKIEGRYALTDDGGAQLAHGKGAETQRVSLPNGQMYHVATERNGAQASPTSRASARDTGSPLK